MSDTKFLRIVITRLLKDLFCSFAISSNCFFNSFEMVIFVLVFKDRVYKCDNCGLEIDRDKNASINLGNYGLV